MEENKKTEKKSKYFIFILIFLILLLILYSRFVGTSGVFVKEIKIVDTSLPREYHGFKIVHFGDVHYGSTVYLQDIKKMVFKINEVKPDIVVFTGDLFDISYLNGLSRLEKNDVVESLCNEFSHIEASIDKYYITGEADKDFKELGIFFENAGFINLNDSSDFIYKGNIPLHLLGLSSNLNSSTNVNDKFLSLTSSFETDSVYHILLLHEPDFIDKIDYSRFNLILAGHTHNGQIRLPYFGSFLFNNVYRNDYYELDKTKLFITNGLGTNKYKFRLFTRPTINFYRLTNK